MEGDLTVDPTTGATVFDSGERIMPPEADDPIPVDEDGRGSVFPVEPEAAVPAPQATAAAPVAAPPPTPPAPGVDAIAQDAMRVQQAALHTHAEGQRLYQQAAEAAQRVSERREKTERDWSAGDVTQEGYARYAIQQEQDTRAATYLAGQAQRKLAEAQDLANNGDLHEMWGAIKAKFPAINETHPALGRLALDLRALREASRFTRPYSELLEEQLETIRSQVGASAPPPATATSAPGAETEGQTPISLEDARTFGLA